MAHQDCSLEFQMNNKSGNIAAVMLDRAFLGPAGRLAVASKVAGNDLVAVLQFFELELPVFVRAKKSMHEHQGRGAAPLADEVQAYSSALAAGLCAATSFCCSCGGAGS